MSIQTTSPTRSKKRREQKRTIETRRKILEAALEEFADKGFDGAILDNMARSIGITKPLIIYHFENKERLWKAVATYNFENATKFWDEQFERDLPDNPKAIDRLALLVRGSLDFVVENGQSYDFLIREKDVGGNRLQWFNSNVINPLLKRFVTEIEQAQKDGDFIEGDPIFLHYMLVGCASVGSSLRAQLELSSGKDISKREETKRYWALLKKTFFECARV